jgi:hypothetical protein
MVGCRGTKARFPAADRTQPIEAVKIECRSAKRSSGGVELFLSEKRSQGLDEHVLKKYDRELTRFREFMAKRSKFFPREIALNDMTEFRAGWNISIPRPPHAPKVHERLTTSATEVVPSTVSKQQCPDIQKYSEQNCCQHPHEHNGS